MKITDKAPVGFTCPAIDEAIQIIENVDMSNYDRLLVLDLLEELREDNAKLREYIKEILENN